MDRRIFLKGLMGSGALGVLPATAFARPAAEREAEVTVVVQAGLPRAQALAAGMTDDRGVIPLTVGADELCSYAGVSALLDRVGRTSLIGVMDDAAAVIFQQIAAARGTGLVAHTQHRIGTESLVSFAINT
ncbi:hypothetical protein [Azoarcus sp. KH32C]|uniref:hypothetical protein n=1 Tax=Azoarcus sp. KH32C TaxID=748247 RepID=UPI000238651B|nr:hypothetical protein [Azoarcus sp. KH32C]BAL25218.1 hypothetical protein AZKH_2918 [Azoarcus sp. KH32C]